MQTFSDETLYHFHGLSTDRKPKLRATANGSTFHEMDTGNKYFYDGASLKWILNKESSGGGQPGPMGPQGPIGPKGDKGDKGDKGEPGITVTKLSELENDANFITSDYHDTTKQDKIIDLDTIRANATLGATAVQPEAGKGLFSGDYNDLINKPEVDSESNPGSLPDGGENGDVLTLRVSTAGGYIPQIGETLTKIYLDIKSLTETDFWTNYIYYGDIRPETAYIKVRVSNEDSYSEYYISAAESVYVPGAYQLIICESWAELPGDRGYLINVTDETLEGNGPISHIPPHSVIKVDYDFETGEQTVELVETDIAVTELPEKAIISEISPGWQLALSPFISINRDFIKADRHVEWSAPATDGVGIFDLSKPNSAWLYTQADYDGNITQIDWSADIGMNWTSSDTVYQILLDEVTFKDLANSVILKVIVGYDEETGVEQAVFIPKVLTMSEGIASVTVYATQAFDSMQINNTLITTVEEGSSVFGIVNALF